MADLATLRKQYNEKLAAAKSLVEKSKGAEGLSPEVSAQIDGLLGETDTLKAQISLLNRVDDAAGFAEEGLGTKAAHLGWREAGPEEGATPKTDPSAWRELEVPGTNVKMRYWVPLAVQVKGYAGAFEAYLRKGYIGDLGPQDRKTLSAGVDTAGGFLVPEDVQASVLGKLATNTAIRSRARVITTSTDLVKWPKVVYNTDDKYTSGVRMTWTGETPTSSTVHRVTEQVYGVEQIPVYTAMASMPLTNQLLEDSAFDVMGHSSDKIAEAFSLGEDDVFINGSGVNRPEGILTHPNASVIYSSPPGIYVKTGSAATLTADGLINLETQLPAQYERNAVWVMSKATKAVIRLLKSAVELLYLWPYGTSGQLGPVPESLMNYPIVKDEFMPAVGANTFPIIFGDLNAYLVVDRVGFSIQVLRELYAETDISLILARKRVGGQLVEPWRIRTHKCEA